MNEELVQEIPPLETIDKFAFSFGVVSICLTEYLVLRKPALVPHYYVLILCFLLSYR